MNALLRILLFAGILFYIPAIAQETANTEVDCKENQEIKEKLSIYYEYYKSKNYKDSYSAWEYVYENCPSAHKNIFIHGPNLLKYKYKKATTEADKKMYLDKMMKVYDDRLVYFPGKKGYVLGKKGSDMVRYKIGTSQEQYNVLKEAYELDSVRLSGSTLFAYFTSSTRLFNEKIFSDEEVFEVYDQVIEAIDLNKEEEEEIIAEYEQRQEDGETLNRKELKILKRTKKSYGAFETVESNVEKVIGKIATCDRLDVLYGSKFEEKKDDLNWVNGGVKMMTRKKCFSSKVFFDLIESKSKLAPGASSYRVAGLLSLSNKKYDKALEYYKKAIEVGSDASKKGEDCYKVAQALFKLGRMAEARNYAYKAISNKKKWGEPYILIGDLYASSANVCGDNVFEKKAVYWAAIDKYTKAKRVDPKVSKSANKKIKSWGSQVPDKTMIFQFGYIGKPKYEVGGWIKESVNVPQS